MDRGSADLDQPGLDIGRPIDLVDHACRDLEILSHPTEKERVEAQPGIAGQRQNSLRDEGSGSRPLALARKDRHDQEGTSRPTAPFEDKMDDRQMVKMGEVARWLDEARSDRAPAPCSPNQRCARIQRADEFVGSRRSVSLPSAVRGCRDTLAGSPVSLLGSRQGSEVKLPIEQLLSSSHGAVWPVIRPPCEDADAGERLGPKPARKRVVLPELFISEETVGPGEATGNVGTDAHVGGNTPIDALPIAMSRGIDLHDDPLGQLVPVIGRRD